MNEVTVDETIAKLKEELKNTQSNLLAYKAEAESLKHEREALKITIAELKNTIDRMNSTISAYRECMMIVAGKKKR